MVREYHKLSASQIWSSGKPRGKQNIYRKIHEIYCTCYNPVVPDSNDIYSILGEENHDFTDVIFKYNSLSANCAARYAALTKVKKRTDLGR